MKSPGRWSACTLKPRVCPGVRLDCGTISIWQPWCRSHARRMAQLQSEVGKVTNMKRLDRIVALVVAVLMASTAWAQQPPQSPQQDPAKPQVRTFEMVLRNAIETAGQNFARR